jgi:hypothetical protein
MGDEKIVVKTLIGKFEELVSQPEKNIDEKNNDNNNSTDSIIVTTNNNVAKIISDLETSSSSISLGENLEKENISLADTLEITTVFEEKKEENLETIKEKSLEISQTENTKDVEERKEEKKEEKKETSQVETFQAENNLIVSKEEKVEEKKEEVSQAENIKDETNKETLEEKDNFIDNTSKDENERKDEKKNEATILSPTSCFSASRGKSIMSSEERKLHIEKGCTEIIDALNKLLNHLTNNPNLLKNGTGKKNSDLLLNCIINAKDSSSLTERECNYYYAKFYNLKEPAVPLTSLKK